VRKITVIVLTLMMLLMPAGQSLAIYTPNSHGIPSIPPTPYTEADIKTAEEAVSRIKWDTSKAESENKLILTLPRYGGYKWVVRKDIGKYVGIGLLWEQMYDGPGGESLELDLTNPEGTGIYLGFSNASTHRVLAIETYIYFPGQGVKYIPPEDRIGASLVDDEGNIRDDIVRYTDIEGKTIDSNDPRVVNRFQHAYIIFSDFDGTHWAYKVIYRLTSLGYIKGYPDNAFRPENNITRAEFAAIMSRLLKNKYPAGSRYDNAGIFPDLAASHWSYGAVSDMLSYMPKEDAARIFGDKFSANTQITRDEVAAVIEAVLKNRDGLAGPAGGVNFSDMGKSRFPSAVSFCVNKGYIKGYPDGSFKPENSITRAEIAAILVKVAESLSG